MTVDQEELLNHPRFTDACQNLLGFLDKKSPSTRLAWVFAEDLRISKGNLCVCWPLPKKNEEIVRSVYDSANARRLGVEFRVVAVSESEVLCTIIVPRDMREAEELMISGFKISVPEKVVNATKSRCQGFLTRLRKSPSSFWDVPSREDL